MDDLDRLREIAQGPAPSVASTARARNRLVDAARTVDGPEGGAGLRWSWRWALAGSGMLAGLLAVTMISQAAPPGSSPGRPSVAGTAARSDEDRSPRVILLAAATAATATEREATGRFWMVQEIDLRGPFRVGTAPNEYLLLGRSVTERWQASNPTDGNWTGSRQLGFTPRSEADRQAWLAAGSPTRWTIASDTVSGTQTLDAQPDAGRLDRQQGAAYLELIGGLDARQVAALPTDPEALRGVLLAGLPAAGLPAAGLPAAGLPAGGPVPSDRGNVPLTEEQRQRMLLSVLQNLLLEAPAPPRVRAAAFTLLSEYPGMRSLGTVQDEVGRSGLGLEIVFTQAELSERTQIIINPNTNLIMAWSYTATHPSAGAGTAIKELHQVIMKSEWTDRRPRVPAIP